MATWGDTPAPTAALRPHCSLDVRGGRLEALEELVPLAHSDASLANAEGLRTQAGYILAFTSKGLNKGRNFLLFFGVLFWGTS